MLRFHSTSILLKEIPDEISLGISFAGCPRHCLECHSPFLWDTYSSLKFYKFLTLDYLDSVLNYYVNRGISCVLSLGGEWNLEALISILRHVRKNYDLKVGLYTGSNLEDLRGNSDLIDTLDYLKVGSYDKNLGGLENRSTNQRLYHIDRETKELSDITYKFWRD